MNAQTIFAMSASVLSVVSTIPYIVDIFRLKTTPHVYSWLIWTILQTTGVFAMLSGGAGIGVMLVIVSAGQCMFVFFLSLRFGTKNITAFDTFCFFGALAAMCIWFFLHNALLSIIAVSVIDLVAFFPTFRKAYVAPQSETASMYFLGGIACLLALLALSDFNVVTSLYLITVLASDIACAVMIWARRAELRSRTL